MTTGDVVATEEAAFRAALVAAFAADLAFALLSVVFELTGLLLCFAIGHCPTSDTITRQWNNK
jgi:hypothetical protein